MRSLTYYFSGLEPSLPRTQAGPELVQPERARATGAAARLLGKDVEVVGERVAGAGGCVDGDHVPRRHGPQARLQRHQAWP